MVAVSDAVRAAAQVAHRVATAVLAVPACHVLRVVAAAVQATARVVAAAAQVTAPAVAAAAVPAAAAVQDPADDVMHIGIFEKIIQTITRHYYETTTIYTCITPFRNQCSKYV